MWQSLELFLVVLISSYQTSLVVTQPFAITTTTTTTTSTVKSDEKSALDFILLHNNDLHGRFDQSTIARTDCPLDDAKQNKCYGGFARHATIIKQHRNAHQYGNGLPVLYLNAGDTYTGTAWFFIYKDQITAELMNALKPDAASLGNHEFDYDIDGLIPYLNNVDFPVVCANLNVSAEHPLWKTRALRRSSVFYINGFKIGVIGYLLPETVNKTNIENIQFSSEIEAINLEAAELKKNGVNIIIGLGHSGYFVDQMIARDCPLIDVVVGAHTHTFLYSGTPPDSDEPYGPYPTIVQQKSGKQVPVVTAYAYSKYMGKLQLSFDKDGNLLRWSGLPILADYRIEQDPEVLKLLDKYRPTVNAFVNDIVAHSKVDLSNDCQRYECNLGNLITDGSVYARAKEYNGTDGWTDAAISIINSGGIRDSIESGNVSKYTLSSILPFENILFRMYVPGHVLKAALEHSVDDFSELYGSRTLLQMSGMHVVYNLNKNIGDRVESVNVLCSNCTIPIYEKLNMNQTYGIMIDTFLHRGGDGYEMFRPYDAQSLNQTTFESTYDYIKHLELLYPAVDGRITIMGHSGTSHATSIIPFSLLITFFATSFTFLSAFIR